MKYNSHMNRDLFIRYHLFDVMYGFIIYIWIYDTLLIIIIHSIIIKSINAHTKKRVRTK
jgi:hypothetical protein